MYTVQQVCVRVYDGGTHLDPPWVVAEVVLLVVVVVALEEGGPCLATSWGSQDWEEDLLHRKKQAHKINTHQCTIHVYWNA